MIRHIISLLTLPVWASLLCLLPSTLKAQQYLNVGPLSSSTQNEGRLSISGSLGELSILSRAASSFVESPTAGERWSIFNSSNSLKFWSGGDKMILTYDGKLGIGISPTFKLDVDGNTRVRNSATASGSYTSLRVQGPDYTHGLEIDYFGNNNYPADPAMSYGGGLGSAAIINVNAKPLTFGTSNTGRMIIDAAGNVGIGLTNPANKIAVVDTQTGTQQTTKPVAKFVNSGNEYSKLVLGSDNTNYDAVISMDNSPTLANTRLRFYIGNGVFSTAGHHNDQIVLTGNGNVGIGTASPDAKLAVKGDIHTQEVKVDMDVPGPDYVFEKDYNLLPLSEVEAYINANKHLPEVPSAKEMEANGLNLKEMNLILLKKIEELTLHVIEIKKENEMLKKESEVIKNEIRKLNN
ncbi:hypothetical protein KK083_01825 [Fulvivirgaceae bacterium PWU4]|uniref:BZIP transcription factor n=1 Tax=Chryseosolibacter histidini TaxID=2782349 RepID=A0AAP2DG50_9BACT|nr:hypothetical protein [Chryseosolibacter histidini]MBT1695595.1 hypothetical protein [Chryseosolibacter histidini]